jgi:hypothetical protein
MIRNSLAFWKTSSQPEEVPSNKLDELNYQVNEKITIVSSYYGAIPRWRGKFIKAKVSKNIQEGDLLIILISAPKGVEREFPEGFEKIISGVKHRKLTMGIAGKVWREGDPTFYPIEKLAKTCFVNLITIRGAKKVIDAKAHITSGFLMEDLIAPRVETDPEGVVLSAFAWDRHRDVQKLTQKCLASLSGPWGGLAVGARPANGCTSKRCKAKSQIVKSPKGDDIAIAISLIGNKEDA